RLLTAAPAAAWNVGAAVRFGAGIGGCSGRVPQDEEGQRSAAGRNVGEVPGGRAREAASHQRAVQIGVQVDDRRDFLPAVVGLYQERLPVDLHRFLHDEVGAKAVCDCVVPLGLRGGK